jgi:ABC-type nickel/cobalt efflux system permease component RcnA
MQFYLASFADFLLGQNVRRSCFLRSPRAQSLCFTHTHTYTHIHTQTHTSTHASAHTHTSTHASTQERAHARAHTHTPARTQAHTHQHARKHTKERVQESGKFHYLLCPCITLKIIVLYISVFACFSGREEANIVLSSS